MRKAVIDQISAERIKHKKEFGFGIMFVNMTLDQSKFIDRMIACLNRAKASDSLRISYAKKIKKDYTAERYKIRNKIFFIKEKFSGRIIDFSKSGLLTCVNKKLQPKSVCDCRIECMNFSIALKGKIIREIKAGNQCCYGILFIDLDSDQKKKIKRVIMSLKRAGFKDRLVDSKPLDSAIIEKYAENTPYKIILFLKNLFMAEK